MVIKDQKEVHQQILVSLIIFDELLFLMNYFKIYLDISEITNWIPPAISTEDLRLLAKTLAQKGDIQKVR